MDCSTTTFVDHIANCTTVLRVNALLLPAQAYDWVIIDKFNKEYGGSTIADADGFLNIPVTDFPDGFFTPYSGQFTFRILDTDGCGWLSFKMANMYDEIAFSVKGGTRVKDSLGCDFACTAGGSGQTNAVFTFTDVPNVHIDWTSLLKQIYGNAPNVTVYHLIAPDTYQQVAVEVMLNGGPYDLQSIDVDNGGPASGYILING